MTEEQIDIDALQRLWMSTDQHIHCDHPEDAVSIDKNGVYVINCRQCGRFGWTDEAGARAMGWIE